jgi:peptide-methionine (S)-S-oxide reductase
MEGRSWEAVALASVHQYLEYMKIRILFLAALALLSVCVAGAQGRSEKTMSGSATGGAALSTFGGGCFWCLEAVYDRIEGVVSVTSGYAGGTVKNPTYEQVCTGTTGHAEVVQVAYDPAKTSYEDLLDIFWKAHDPTTLNRQGADVGTQYRSIILYHDEAQKAAAQRSLTKAQAGFKDRIVTEIAPLGVFWKAEDYHQDYYNANKSAGYCRVVISPKLKKLGLE